MCISCCTSQLFYHLITPLAGDAVPTTPKSGLLVADCQLSFWHSHINFNLRGPLTAFSGLGFGFAFSMALATTITTGYQWSGTLIVSLIARGLVVFQPTLRPLVVSHRKM